MNHHDFDMSVCPKCGAEQRSSSDGRSPLIVGTNRKWIRCIAGGEGCGWFARYDTEQDDDEFIEAARPWYSPTPSLAKIAERVHDSRLKTEGFLRSGGEARALGRVFAIRGWNLKVAAHMTDPAVIGSVVYPRGASRKPKDPSTSARLACAAACWAAGHDRKLMFVLRDLHGGMVSASCRWNGLGTRPSGPKAMALPRDMLGSPPDVRMFGDAPAWILAASQGRRVALCEGAPDMIAALTAGVPAVAAEAAGGLKRLSTELAGLLVAGKSAPKIVVVPHSDETGQENMGLAADILANAGANIYEAQLPEGCGDLCDVLDGGARPIEVTRLLNHAPQIHRTFKARYVGQAGEALPVLSSGRLAPEKPIYLLKSALGTGKTQWAAKLAAGERGAPVYAIAHRCALVSELARRFDLPDYRENNYNGATSPDGCAITVDSLCKIPYEKAPGVVVIDEVAQVLRHLVGKTVGSDAPEILVRLRDLLRSARVVVALDADADSETKRLLEGVTGRRVLMLCNTWKPTLRSVHVFTSRPDWRGQLRQDILDLPSGKTGLVATTRGVKGVETLATEIEMWKPGIRVLRVHRDSARTPDIQAILGNLDAVAHHFDVIVYSPTLGSGVDLSRKDQYAWVAGDVAVHNIGADEVMQQLSRCRHPMSADIAIYIDARRQDRPTTVKKVRGMLSQRRLQAEDAAKWADWWYPSGAERTRLLGAEGGALEQVARFYEAATAHVHRETANIKRLLLARWKELGWAVCDDCTPELRKIEDEKIKEARQTLKKARGLPIDRGGREAIAKAKAELELAKEAHARLLAPLNTLRATKRRARREVEDAYVRGVGEAKPIDSATAKHLKTTDSISPAEVAQLQRYEISMFYTNAPESRVDDELIRDDQRGELRKALRLLSHVVLEQEGTEEASAASALPDAVALSSGRPDQIRNRRAAASAIGELMALYGVPVGENWLTYRGELEPDGWFADKITATGSDPFGGGSVAERIRDLIGVKPRRMAKGTAENDKNTPPDVVCPADAFDPDNADLMRYLSDVLRKVGLKLAGKQTKAGGVRRRIYRLDATTVSRRVAQAQAEVARLKGKCEDALSWKEYDSRARAARRAEEQTSEEDAA